MCHVCSITYKSHCYPNNLFVIEFSLFYSAHGNNFHFSLYFPLTSPNNTESIIEYYIILLFRWVLICLQLSKFCVFLSFWLRFQKNRKSYGFYEKIVVNVFCILLVYFEVYLKPLIPIYLSLVWYILKFLFVTKRSI